MYDFDPKFNPADLEAAETEDFTALHDLILLTVPRQSETETETKKVEVQCLRRSSDGELCIFGDGTPLVFPDIKEFIDAVDVVSIGAHGMVERP